MRMNSNTILAGRGVNALAALDAGNRARAFQEDAQFQNALRPMQMESAQLGVQQQRQALELGRERIGEIRRQAAAAAAQAEDRDALESQTRQAITQMNLAAAALRGGDTRPWNQLLAGMQLPQMEPTQENFEQVTAMLAGLNEGLQTYRTSLVDATRGPEPQAPLSPAGKLAADLRAGRITQEQYDAATTKTPLVNFGSGVQVVDEKRGVIAVPDGNGGVTYQNIPGGLADQEARAAQGKTDMREGLAATSSDVVVSAASRAREAAKNRLVGGGAGAIAAYNPASQNAEIYRQVEVLRSMAAAENINAMRQASPTGGALGNASDADILLLKNKSGVLDPASPNFERDLADYERTLLETIHGREAGRRIFNETRQVQPMQQEAPGRGSVAFDPPPAAVQLLRDDPSLEAQREFDEAFGEGAAARALRR